MDVGIVNGRVYIDNRFAEENVYIKNGRIEAVTKGFLPCREEIDAKGKLVLPGFIDPHVHFQLKVGANTSKDDFYTGSIQGALGGVTTFIDFLDPVKAVKDFEGAYINRRKQAEVSVTDYSFHSTIANPIDEPADMLKAGLQAGIPSLKLFTTYSNTDRRTYDYYIDGLLKESKEFGSRIVIHAENDHLVNTKEDILIKAHETARPVLSERTEVVKLAEIAKERDGLLYIVHVSAGSSAKLLTENYKKELVSGNIILESCPHYFLLDSERYKEEKGYLYTMTPPLRGPKEQKLMKEYLDAFQVIATDHCPFDVSLKKKEYTSQIPMGVGGIRYSFATMFTEFGEKIIPKFTKGPAMAYGLYPKKGNLFPGADGDVVLYDDRLEEIIQDKESIYNGKTVKGKVTDVFLRGQHIVKEGSFLSSGGEFVKRQPGQ